jgi:hypothetical protein
MNAFVRYAGFFLLVVALGLAGCKKTLKQRLIGKWDYQSITINGQTTYGDKMSNPVMEFKEDGQLVTITGNIKTTEGWELHGDTIILKGDAQPQYLKITLFTPEHLVLESQVEPKSTITLAPLKEERPFYKDKDEDEEKEHKH